MANKKAFLKSDLIDSIGRLIQVLELSDENPFKIRAFQKGKRVLETIDDTELEKRIKEETLIELDGIGKGISQVVTEFYKTGDIGEIERLNLKLPRGLIELTQIPGLGAKKARILSEELSIHSIGELEYACKENRLVDLKGFGDKTQEKILAQIKFFRSVQGQLKLSDVWDIVDSFKKEFRKKFPAARIEEAGALRRRLEVLTELDFIVNISQEECKGFEHKASSVLPIKIHFSDSEHFGFDWAKATATQAHWKALGEPKKSKSPTKVQADEKEFYKNLDLPWIPPECRETGTEVKLWNKDCELELSDIQGVFHNHTLASDGKASLEEMVLEAKRLGYKYIGLSDHSQSAFYARGLKLEDLKKQKKELDQVQERHPEIKIFWGVESDILGDGSLDYDDSVLKHFDFVIASVHSRFQMDEKQMTERILRAIRNPYTRFLGHPTGRLLLSREPYALDIEAVVKVASQCGVALEINSNPWRLDLDWRNDPLFREYQSTIAISPDAHDIEGLSDVRYGVWMAKKAMLEKNKILNTKSLKDIQQWLKK